MMLAFLRHRGGGATTSFVAYCTLLISVLPSSTTATRFTVSRGMEISDLLSYCNSLPDGTRCCTINEDGTGDTSIEACNFSIHQGSMTISAGACRGSESCHDMSFDDGSYLGYNTCVGDKACKGLGWSNNEAASALIQLDDGSCNSFDATYQGGQACFKVAHNSAVKYVHIGKNSCSGESHACSFLGEKYGRKIDIEDDSCQGGYMPCYYLGNKKAKRISIDVGSCQGNGSCKYLGLHNAVDITIGQDTCISGNDVCNGVGFLTATNIYIGDGSCQGDSSCFFVGRANALDIQIGNLSCLDTKACTSIGEVGRVGIDIQNRACQGVKSCMSVGNNGTMTTVTIGADSCQSDNACLDCGSQCTVDVHIPSNDQECPATFAGC